MSSPRLAWALGYYLMEASKKVSVEHCFYITVKMIVKGYSGIASHIRGPYCVKSIVELITPAKYTKKNEQNNRSNVTP